MPPSEFHMPVVALTALMSFSLKHIPPGPRAPSGSTLMHPPIGLPWTVTRAPAICGPSWTLPSASAE